MEADTAVGERSFQLWLTFHILQPQRDTESQIISMWLSSLPFCLLFIGSLWHFFLFVFRRDFLSSPFFFNWSPWKLSGPFTDGITKAVFLKLTNSKESAYSFLWQPAFNPGSHVTSNCEHDVQVPLRPKFPPSKSSPSAATGTCQGEWSSDTLLL